MCDDLLIVLDADCGATGSSAVCPASVNVADKTRCDEDSVCYQGVSVTLIYTARHLSDSLTETVCVAVPWSPISRPLCVMQFLKPTFCGKIWKLSK